MEQIAEKLMIQLDYLSNTSKKVDGLLFFEDESENFLNKDITLIDRESTLKKIFKFRLEYVKSTSRKLFKKPIVETHLANFYVFLLDKNNDTHLYLQHNFYSTETLLPNEQLKLSVRLSLEEISKGLSSKIVESNTNKKKQAIVNEMINHYIQ